MSKISSKVYYTPSCDVVTIETAQFIAMSAESTSSWLDSGSLGYQDYGQD